MAISRHYYLNLIINGEHAEDVERVPDDKFALKP